MLERMELIGNAQILPFIIIITIVIIIIIIIAFNQSLKTFPKPVECFFMDLWHHQNDSGHHRTIEPQHLIAQENSPDWRKKDVNVYVQTLKFCKGIQTLK